ncbi:DNA gyrase/topoisomerase IV subunit A [Jonesia quinghaiensis]|uniref:DNA gyrase/topoisomerase IV subunit A n=1 Tax=Jonesia quinghaiensis TaxID=262806 RepID=UPI0003FF3A0E|nr:DNA topoisomerase IV subunit A [Jonesia quinghaiensis]
MARRSAVSSAEPIAERIIDVDVAQEMETSFLEYAYSVIYARALPDARDGLKPVQRRILFQMADMGLRPDRGHVKCSRVVGEVMGKLHPHGDSAIYDALVRLAQPFSLRLPLVDGHGNFGSLDDGPAASRYTEARLASSALAMTADLSENVVDFIPNYDNKLTQPEVLPAAIPNLLVNGASGIAVGMATNLAPHNLVEVVSAARHLLAHPDATLEELMRFVPGPDLPSGGRVVGLDGVRDAYRTGRGSFRTRATATVENVTARRKGIVVTELPYLVGPEKVIEKIKEGVTAKKLSGIATVTDLTDRAHGLKLVIEIKTGFNPEAVLEALYRYTPLEESFGINNVALVDGQPRTLGLKEMLQVWVDHRVTVIKRRSEHRLAKRRERQHLVLGLLRAIVDIDEVIDVIRSSDDSETARTRLMSVFDLTHVQAEYILELRLRRLTKFSRLELEKENEELTAQIAELEAILGDVKQLHKVVAQEMTAVSKTYGTPRRTVLLDSDGSESQSAVGTVAAKRGSAGLGVSLEIADTPCWVMLGAGGRVARTTDDQEPVRGDERSAHDIVRSIVPGTVRGHVGVVTSAGRIIKLSVVELPSLPGSQGGVSLAGGVDIGEIVHCEPGEQVIALVSLSPTAEPITLGTASGTVKRVTPGEAPKGDAFDIITLKDGDTVIGAGHAPDSSDLVFVTSQATLLRFEASTVRPQGRPAGGMAGIKLPAGARAVSFSIIPADSDARVVTIAGSSGALDGTEAASIKVSPFDLYPRKGRATAGVRAHRFLKGEDTLTQACVSQVPVKAADTSGKPCALPEDDQRRDGSGTPLTHTITFLG